MKQRSPKAAERAVDEANRAITTEELAARKKKGWIVKDIAGERFGNLTAIMALNRKSSAGSVYWLCRCDCGRELDVNGNTLRNGKSTRCIWCVNKGINTRHGNSTSIAGKYAPSRLYTIWIGIKARCTAARPSDGGRYYERGIRMCSEWKDDFVAFHDWALANGYSDNLSIDRIDNNGNYEAGNCRWATRKQQNRNTRGNRLVYAFGETKTVIEWSEDRRCAIRATALYHRIEKGWPPELAIATPKLPPNSLSMYSHCRKPERAEREVM